ncbi:agmatine deiminase family protein [Plantactinospora veratri]
MLTFPPEWERHKATVVSWPRRPEVWGSVLPDARAEYESLIRTISESEEVLLVVHPADMASVTWAAKLPRLAVLRHPIDDGWVRDNGPLFCLDDARPVAVDFDFNSWGNRFRPSDGDRSLGRAVSGYFGVRRTWVPWVLEGGAVSTNGSGDLLSSAESVLHPNRNGRTTLEEATGILSSNLGVDRLIWIPHGLLEDLKNTDGHVDNVAVFCDSETVLVQSATGDNPNCERLAGNTEAIRSQAPDLTVVQCDRLPYVRLPDGSNQPAPYLNFVLTRDSIILPTVGSQSDAWARGSSGRCFRGER